MTRLGLKPLSLGLGLDDELVGFDLTFICDLQNNDLFPNLPYYLMVFYCFNVKMMSN